MVGRANWNVVRCPRRTILETPVHLRALSMARKAVLITRPRNQRPRQMVSSRRITICQQEKFIPRHKLRAAENSRLVTAHKRKARIKTSVRQPTHHRVLVSSLRAMDKRQQATTSPNVRRRPHSSRSRPIRSQLQNRLRLQRSSRTTKNRIHQRKKTINPKTRKNRLTASNTKCLSHCGVKPPQCDRRDLTSA